MKTFKATILFSLIVFCLTSVSSNAQRTIDGGQGFLHIGLGYGGYTDNGYNSLPAVGVSYDRNLNREFGPGLISIGGLIGFNSSSQKINSEKFYDRHTFFAARTMYHWDPINTNNFDIYGGLVLGARRTKSKFLKSTLVSNEIVESSKTRFWIGGLIGGQYFFTERFGAYAELGYSVAYFNLGFSLKM